MSDTDNSTEATEAAEAEQQPEATDQPDEDQADTKAGKEAAKYRHRLREAEAERDTLAAQVDGLRRTIVDTEVANRGFNPAGFWAAGIEVADLLDEDGSVDLDKVGSATHDAAKRLGLTSKRGNVSPHEGGNPRVTPRNDFAGAFTPQVP